MAYAPERWRARGWFAQSSRRGLRPDATARAAHAFGPYAESALAELNTPLDAPLKIETAPAAHPRGDSGASGGLSARLNNVEASPRTEPAKKTSPILAPRNTLPVRPETKSAAPDAANTQSRDSKRVESVAEKTSSDSEANRAVSDADRWRAPITVK